MSAITDPTNLADNTATLPQWALDIESRLSHIDRYDDRKATDVLDGVLTLAPEELPKAEDARETHSYDTGKKFAIRAIGLGYPLERVAHEMAEQKIYWKTIMGYQEEVQAYTAKARRESTIMQEPLPEGVKT